MITACSQYEDSVNAGATDSYLLMKAMNEAKDQISFVELELMENIPCRGNSYRGNVLIVKVPGHEWIQIARPGDQKCKDVKFLSRDTFNHALAQCVSHKSQRCTVNPKLAQGCATPKLPTPPGDLSWVPTSHFWVHVDDARECSRYPEIFGTDATLK